MRLQQFIARCGVASRRKAEELITQGQVTVNGKLVTKLGVKIDPSHDSVKCGGKLLRQEQFKYIVLYKPEGVVTTMNDEKGRPTVAQITSNAMKERVFPVGRLDFNTTGCLLMTNDGEWANRIIHPKYGVRKRYTAKVKGRVPQYAVERLVKGVRIEGRRVEALEAKVLKSNDKNDIISMTITEGLNHQVRNMLAAVGLSVIRLRRESVGIVTLKGLEPGTFRHLAENEIQFFRSGGHNEKRHKILQVSHRQDRPKHHKAPSRPR